MNFKYFSYTETVIPLKLARIFRNANSSVKEISKVYKILNKTENLEKLL